MTDGNPLLVTEMLANSGVRSSSIDELITTRADELTPAARAFLDYCSIIPRRVSIEHLESAETENEHLHECLRSGLLLSDGDGVAFRHELTRHAIEAALTPLQRKQLHANELDRLDALGASAARRLHHAIASNNRGRILELAPIAASQAASLGAHREAAKALGALFDAGAPTDDPELGARYAFELHMIGDLPESIAWQRRVIDLYEKAEDQLRLGDAQRFLSRLYYMNGERKLADAAAQLAVQVLEPLGETGELALAYATLGQLAMLADRNSEAIRWSEMATPMAERLGRIDILATSLINHGSALQVTDHEAGLAMLDRSIELGKSSASHEHVARAYINRAWSYLSRFRMAEALPLLGEGVEYCSDHDLAHWEQYLRGGRALAHLGLGDWDQAEEEAQIVLGHKAASGLVRNSADRAAAMLRIRQGLPGIAKQLRTLEKQGAEGTETPRFNSYAVILAEHSWTSGEMRAEALSVLERAFDDRKPDGSPWDASLLWFWSRKLEKPLKPPAEMPEPFARLNSGDVDGAAGFFELLQLPFEQALVRIEGDAEQAAKGLAIFDQLGAVATANRARSDLLERGIRKGTRGPRASTRKNRFGLTSRELDVLQQIDGGLSNKEIANRLFVSPKTVDHHVSSILAKTETSSRGEAASIARSECLLK